MGAVIPRTINELTVFDVARHYYATDTIRLYCTKMGMRRIEALFARIVISRLLIPGLIFCAFFAWAAQIHMSFPNADYAPSATFARQSANVVIACVTPTPHKQGQDGTDQLDFDELGIGTACPPVLPQPVGLPSVDRVAVVTTTSSIDQSDRVRAPILGDPDIPDYSQAQKSTVVLLI